MNSAAGFASSAGNKGCSTDSGDGHGRFGPDGPGLVCLTSVSHWKGLQAWPVAS